MTFLFLCESIFALIAWKDNSKHLFGKTWRSQLKFMGHIYRLSGLWILWALHSCVSLGMPPLESKWQKTFNKNSCMSSPKFLSPFFSSPWLFFQLLLNSFLLSSRTEVLDVQGTWKEKVEDSQLAKAPLSTQAAHFPHWSMTFPLCHLCTEATVLWHTIQWQSHLTGFFPSHFWFYPASKKKSTVSVVLRAWGNTEKWIRELIWL